MRLVLGQTFTVPTDLSDQSVPRCASLGRVLHHVSIGEARVPWEDTIDESFERKKLQCAKLAKRRAVKACPIEVGYTGPTRRYTMRLLKELGTRGQPQRKTKDLAS